MGDASHTIYIRHEPFGCGFDVTVEPPVDGFNFDRECPDHKFARTYANGIKLHRGWPVIDQTMEGSA